MFYFGWVGKGGTISGVDTTYPLINNERHCKPTEGLVFWLAVWTPRPHSQHRSSTKSNLRATLTFKYNLLSTHTLYVIGNAYHMLLPLFIYITLLANILQTSTGQGIAFLSTYIQFLISNRCPQFDVELNRNNSTVW